MKKDTVILFVTHRLSDTILDRFNVLKNQTDSFADVVLLYQKEENTGIDIPQDINWYTFNVESLNELDYNPICETIIPGSNHFALLRFYRDHPAYHYYWNIEYDVCFSGKWSRFFNEFSSGDADFLSSHLKRYADYPDWMWWDTMDTQLLSIPKSEYIKSFNPIYRISNKALALLDSMLANGLKGHHEVLIPTLLHYYHLKLVDFGGNGEFVMPGYEDRFYLSLPGKESIYVGGTMSYRPVLNSPGDIPDKLYHPVK